MGQRLGDDIVIPDKLHLYLVTRNEVEEEYWASGIMRMERWEKQAAPA